LLTAALAAFNRDGADVPLEVVARDAGVGIGTLYRHFPSREALLAAVYQRENERLCQRAHDLLESTTPTEALALWTDAFVEYAAQKRGLAVALKSMIAVDSSFFAESKARLHAAAQALLDAAHEAGEVGEGMAGSDLIRAMGGICMAASTPEESDQARRLVGLLLDGLRYRAQ
jgi:AcrR family transcriptional regulator